MAGPYFRSLLGADLLAESVGSSINTFAMGPINSGWCARFMAPDARDIATVYINWFAVTAAGTVQLRIETIDATTGKPSGTLYDANAVLNFTPVVGWQSLTFATLPTAGLIAGNEYGIVLLTTVAGTTHTLSSNAAVPNQPAVTLTAADGTVRANFTAASNSPICTVVLEDGSETAFGLCPYQPATGRNAAGLSAIGAKFVVPSGVVLSVAAIKAVFNSKSGSVGDLRVRIFDAANVLVSGASMVADKDSILANTRCMFLFPAAVTIRPGTYRVVIDSQGTTGGGNFWQMRGAAARVAALNTSGFFNTFTADVTATPIVWTDVSNEQPPIALVLDNVSGSGGGDFAAIG